MRTVVHLSCVLACVLSGCTAEPADTTNNDTSGSGGSTTDTATSTGETGSTGDTPTTGATADASSGSADTGTSSGDSSSTGAIDSTSDGSTSDGTTSAGTTSDGSTSDGSGSDSGSDSSTGEPAGLGQAALDTVAALEAAVDGVYYLSESDYPWVVVAFADGAPVTEANVKALIADVYVPHDGGPTLEERAIEVRTLAQLLDPLTVPQDWWTDENVMMAAQYQPIRDVLEDNLTNIQVFRLGKLYGDILMGAIDVYVLGETVDGDIVGMWTVAVET